MSSATTAARIANARRKMAEAQIPALLVSQMDNVRWMTGFTGSNGFVMLTADTALFATDSRYIVQAAKECIGFEFKLLETSAPEEITAILAESGHPRIGFESSSVNYALYQSYREKLDDKIELVPVKRLVDDLRMVKDAGEIELIQEACHIADKVFDFILPQIKPGVTERELMLEMEWHIRKDCGAEVAFDTIVASGPRSALPHGKAADRVLTKGDFVTFDFGARVNGYCSDITRTVLLGEPTDEQLKVYQTVLDAENKTIEGLVPGAAGKDVDAIARSYIEDAGYGDYFGHGAGHSLGRAVHDGPGLSIKSEVTIAAGMVITVEPGIYIPDWGGVRIEDDVLVTEDGPRVLTHSPKRLMCL
jgi:Xaa-Pro aminopeptidase